MKGATDAWAATGKTWQLAGKKLAEKSRVWSEALEGPGRTGCNWKREQYGIVVPMLDEKHQRIEMIFEDIFTLG
jgi:hypothetical protein